MLPHTGIPELSRCLTFSSSGTGSQSVDALSRQRKVFEKKIPQRQEK